MMTEIKRSNWVRFCKRFNVNNQLRSAAIKVRAGDSNEAEIEREAPFMGMAIIKKGRFIKGVEFFIQRRDPSQLVHPALAVDEPVAVHLERDSDGKDRCLSVEGKSGTVAKVILSGERISSPDRTLVEKLAYTMYEQRGFVPGNDVNDWTEAERKIKEVELQFTR